MPPLPLSAATGPARLVPDLSSILVHGAADDSSLIAAAFAVEGVRVVYLEPDATAVERVTHHLGRLGAGAVQIIAPGQALPPVDLVVIGAEYPQGIHGEPLVVSTRAVTPDCAHPMAQLAFAGPAHLRALVEVVAHDLSPQNSDKLFELLHYVGKTPLCVPYILTIPLLDHMLICLDDLLLRGALHVDLDAALCAAGADLGLCAAQDLIGLDRAYGRRRVSGGPRLLAQDRMVEEGRLGVQSSVGWYRYPGGGGAVEDPLIEDLIAEEAHFAGIPQQDITGAAALDQLIETARLTSDSLLAQGIPADTLDLVWRLGLGLPRCLVDRILPAPAPC